MYNNCFESGTGDESVKSEPMYYNCNWVEGALGNETVYYSSGGVCYKNEVAGNERVYHKSEGVCYKNGVVRSNGESSAISSQNDSVNGEDRREGFDAFGVVGETPWVEDYFAELDEFFSDEVGMVETEETETCEEETVESSSVEDVGDRKNHSDEDLEAERRRYHKLSKEKGDEWEKWGEIAMNGRNQDKKKEQTYKEQLKLANLPREEPVLFSEPDDGEDDLELPLEVGYGGEDGVLQEIEQETLQEIGEGIVNANRLSREMKETNIEEKLIKERIKLKLEAKSSFPVELRTKLRHLLNKYWGSFALPESKGRMSLLSPIRCTLKKDAPDGLMVRNRTIGEKKEKWLQNKVDEMCEGFILKPVAHALYASQVFVVPKKGPAQFRMVVDMRPLNRITVRTQLQLPLLEQQFKKIRGARLFCTLDVKSGYDYLPTEDSSKKYFNLIMPWGAAYEMQGAPQGWINSPMYFQDRMVRELMMPTGYYLAKTNGILQWIDDTLIYAEDEEMMFKILEAVLKQLQVKRVRLSLMKCNFFEKQVEYCGRVLKENTWSFNESYYKKILSMRRPGFKYQLAEVLYLATWLSPTIPHLAEIRDELADGIRMGESMKKMKQANEVVIWNQNKLKSWERFKKVLKEAAKTNLDLYDGSRALNIFTDASREFWGALVTQCDHQELKKPELKDQIHYPLMFFSGRFNATQQKWQIAQLELFPIIHLSTRLDYMIYGHPTSTNVFTDHRNLLYLIHPSWSPNRAHLDRLSRWCLRFQQMNMKIHHIEGRENVFADALSRWGNEEYNSLGEMINVARVSCYEEAGDEVRSFGELMQIEVFRVKDVTRKEELGEVLERLERMRVSFLSAYSNEKWKQVSEEEICQAQQEDETLTENERRRAETGELVKRRGRIFCSLEKRW